MGVAQAKPVAATPAAVNLGVYPGAGAAMVGGGGGGGPAALKHEVILLEDDEEPPPLFMPPPNTVQVTTESVEYFGVPKQVALNLENHVRTKLNSDIPSISPLSSFLKSKLQPILCPNSLRTIAHPPMCTC